MLNQLLNDQFAFRDLVDAVDLEVLLVDVEYEMHRFQHWDVDVRNELVEDVVLGVERLHGIGTEECHFENIFVGTLIAHELLVEVFEAPNRELDRIVKELRIIKFSWVKLTELDNNKHVVQEFLLGHLGFEFRVI